MKIAIIVVRILLGAMFLIFGLNGLFHFMPMPPMPQADWVTWISIMMRSDYIKFVSVVQVTGGLLVLVGRYVPLGLTLLGPVIANILAFHLTLQHGGVGMGLVVFVLWLFLMVVYRTAFYGIFAADPLIRTDLKS